MTTGLAPPGRHRVSGAALAATVAIVVVAVVGGALVLSRLGGGDADPRSTLPDSVRVTDPIVVETLLRTVRAPATLTPIRSLTVGHPADVPGVVTALPFADGTVVASGAAVVELSGRPVFLLAGEFPAWRRFEPGMAPGRDVSELEQALAGIGILGVPPDEEFDESAQALRDLHTAAGYRPGDGLDPFQVLFVPDGRARVDAPSVRVGDVLGEGAVSISVAGLERRVRLDLAPTALEILAPDQAITLRTSTGDPVLSTAITAVTVEQGSETGNLRTVYVELRDQPAEEVAGPLTAEIEIESSGVPVPTASPAAVFSDEEGAYVVVVEDGIERRVDVEVGMVGDRRVALLGDDLRLRDGTELVLNPSR